MRHLHILIILFLAINLAGQTTQQTSFGKNRVQYNRQLEEWRLYESANFVTYWYGDARNVGQSALQIAEMDFSAIQQLLEQQLGEKVEMLVFTDLTDLKQSNIGEEDVFLLRTGETKVVGNKIFVYFDGDHNHLRSQIREGVAGVLINAMLFGSNLQEIVQNAVLLNLPGWYTTGLASYCGETWNVAFDDSLRDLFSAGRYKNFDGFAKDHPRLAGHAFWYYIALHYGRGTISNLLYLTRINRSIEAGFLYVLGSGYRRTTDAMLEYFEKRYSEEVKSMEAPEESTEIIFRNKKNLPLTEVKISPDGRRLAYITNDIGKWKVFIHDLETGKRKRIQRGGARNALQTPDYNYPLLAWNPDNQRLAVLFERRDVPRLAFYDTNSGKKEVQDLSPEYQRVYNFEFLNNSDLVFSAAARGNADIFIYRSVTRQTERITQDFWDDLDVAPVLLEGKKGLLFASNRLRDSLLNERLDTILPVGTFDIFYFDLETRSKELVRITNSPMTDERHPRGIDSTNFVFLNDEYGIFNRSGGFLEPYTAYYQTTIFMRDGSEIKAVNVKQPGEWPLEKVLEFLAPVDTVLKNIDTTQIDSIKTQAILKKRPVTWNESSFDRNIYRHDLSPRAGRMVDLIHREGRAHLFQRRYHPSKTPNPVYGRLTRHRELQLRNAGMPLPPQSTNGKTGSTNGMPTGLESPTPVRDTFPDGWLFVVPEHLSQSAYIPPANQEPNDPEVIVFKTDPKPQVDTITLVAVRPVSERERRQRGVYPGGQVESVTRFNPAQIIPYRLRFRTDYISTSMNNDLLFEGLELYTDSLTKFRQPPPGILIKANLKDLLENYVVEAGFRLPTTFNGTEFYLWMEDKKKRIDRRYALYRRSLLTNLPKPGPNSSLLPPNQVRTNTLLGQYELRYPFDVYTSVRATFSLRQDRNIFLSTDEASLDSSDYSEQRAMVRLSAVYDNTVDVDINLRTGTRAKFYVDVVKGFALNTQPSWSFNLKNGFMTIIGLDARHYQLIDRRSILALRLAGAMSFGTEKMLYILGGVDNWLFPTFNENITQPSPEDFAYRTSIANLRGFSQNIRNGNNFALFNAELRIPIFKYFSKRPVMGNFWRNFQLIGFFDAGTAWQGKNPYSGDNPINIRYFYSYSEPLKRNIITMKVNYFRDPLVAGYGVGVRTLLFGMYVRADYAWGIETGMVQKPVFYLALGRDF